MRTQKVKVKICGITNWTDARRAVEAGAEFLGFNFYRPSPRYIRPAAARRIVRRLPKKIAAVGVFVNEPEESMLAIARQAGLRYLQLHGDETPEVVARVERKVSVIKVIRVGETFHCSHLTKFGRASALMLDGFDKSHYGGTGKTFNWKLAKQAKESQPIFVAGGLTPENVCEAIQVAQPYAVDVCSGVESRPGKKDWGRITALMNAVKSAAKATRRKRK